MLRVLMVVTDTDRRGAQVFASDLHHALQGRCDVETVALAPGATGGLDVPTLGPTRRDPRTLLSLRQRAKPADVVVAHGSTTLPMCALACAGTRTPFVYRQISDSLFWASTRLRLLRTRQLLSRAARVVTLWSGAADVLEHNFALPPARLTIIPNGVPPSRFPQVTTADRTAARSTLALPVGAPVVTYAGALVDEKGVDALIAALALSEARSSAHLLVAGDGPARPTLEALAAERLADRAHFVGSLADPWTAYAASDLVAFPSRGGDSMPAVVIEAAFAGIPLVATAVAAVPQMIENGTSGVLVAPDDLTAMGAAIDRVLGDAHLASRLADANRKAALVRYDIDVVAGQWLETLTSTALA